MIHRDVEESLNLPGVEFNGKDAGGTGRSDEIGYQLGSDGCPGRNLAVLPGIAIVGNDSGDSLGRGSLERVDENQQLHQILIHGPADRLYDKNIHAPYTFVNIDIDLAIAEPSHQCIAEINPKNPSNSPGKLGI